MSRAAVLIVADDLTGGNATAAGFARIGLRAVTVGAHQPLEVVGEFAGRFDVVVVSTDSRHHPPEQAAARVAAAVRAGWPVGLVGNRVDSTLRGNLGATTAAALSAVHALSGRRAVALCQPAHPAAGRHTVQGTQLLDGVRLEETELAQDPRAPVRTSDVAARLREQADLRVGRLLLATVTGATAGLEAAVRALLSDGVEVVVADALTTGHLDRVAAAAVAAGGDQVAWVSVDPGPGSVALARALGLTTLSPARLPDRNLGHGNRASSGGPLLAVSGSATRLTRVQLARLRAEHQVVTVRPPAGAGQVPDVAATAAALAAALAGADPGAVVLLATVLDDADVTRITPQDAARLPAALAAAVRGALEHQPVAGLFATGGDVTAALLAELGAAGLDVEQELVPLAVAGTLVGGPWEGLPVATKGGLVGGPDTTLACVRHLTGAAQARRRHARAAQPPPTAAKAATDASPEGPADASAAAPPNASGQATTAAPQATPPETDASGKRPGRHRPTGPAHHDEDERLAGRPAPGAQQEET